MQVHIRQQRRYHTALGRSGLGMRHRSLLHHARIEPLADEAHEHPVAYPKAQEVPEMLMGYRVVELTNVQLHYCPAVHRHRRAAHRFRCRERATPGPKAIRARQEDLLVDALQRHHHRALQHLVLEGRNANRTRRALLALRDVHSPHGWSPVLAGLRAVE